jgi:Glycosyl transferase family 2
MPDDIDRRIAVLIPCLNEEATIGLVVKKFKAVLPGAALYVVDNKSTDDTERVAREASAVVMRGTRRGTVPPGQDQHDRVCGALGPVRGYLRPADLAGPAIRPSSLRAAALGLLAFLALSTAIVWLPSSRPT